MAKFPVDAPIGRVTGALELLGFRVVREGNHIAMARENADGTKNTLTIPNHARNEVGERRLWVNMVGSPPKS